MPGSRKSCNCGIWRPCADATLPSDAVRHKARVGTSSHSFSPFKDDVSFHVLAGRRKAMSDGPAVPVASSSSGVDARFFVGANHRRLPVETASGTFRRLFERVGLKPESSRMGPRPYDLRNAFAVPTPCSRSWSMSSRDAGTPLLRGTAVLHPSAVLYSICSDRMLPIS